MASIETPSGKGAGDENFPVGSRLIRADLRPHIHTFYQFARAADDIADTPALGAAEKVSRLALMAAVVDGAATDESPAAARMRASLIATAMPAQHCLDLLEAFRTDATKLRYASWSELMTYCRYSAAPVGRYVLDLHGESTDTWPASDALCAALQVINHLQDCADDYRQLDRVYIPEDILAAEGAEIGDLARPATTPAFRRVLDALLGQTEALLVTAAALPRQVRDRRLKYETAIIVALAARLVRRLRREDPLAERVRLGKFDVLRAAIVGSARAIAGGSTATSATAAADEKAIVERVRASGTSFFLAMRLLPARRRSAMYAIYAFCREVDDIADGTDPPAAKAAGLDAWRGRIDALYSGRPDHFITRALLDPVRRYGLRRDDFIAVIDGMAMDAEVPTRPMTLAELDLYCARVASAVGQLSVRAFGATEPAAMQVAESLGRALQLTNILRDVAEDAGLGRVYLPQELLAAHGISDTEPDAILHHPALPAVCADLAALADRHFAAAWEAMRRCRRRPMRPAAVMAAMYRAIFVRLKQHGWDVVTARPKVPTLVKLWVVVRYGII